jgi:hypothetical protein
MMRLDRSSARRAMFAVPLWACAVVPALAEQQEATVVLGAGQKSCGEYLAAVYGLSPGRFRVETTPTGKTYGNDARALYEWLAGFISAANAASPDGCRSKPNPPLLMCGCGNTASKTELAACPTRHSSARTEDQMTALVVVAC